MNQIVIKPFDITTTQFGFGCSSLLGLLSERESRALIDAAYDAGIRHFDVARSYGHGAAEGLLAKALGKRRKNVTIATKFGLPVPKNQVLVQAARRLARPFVKRLSGLRQRSKSAVAAISSTVSFTRAEANKSLDTSLQELRSDYIDLFLLHEVRQELLIDDQLLDFLRECVRAGKIRGHGIGSDLTAIPDLIETNPEYCPVVQHEWSVLTQDVPIPANSFRICHGALLRSLGNVKYFRSASDQVGMDLSNPATLSALLLRSAVLRHPDAITLFSARSPERIQANVESLGNAKLDVHCAKLCTIIGSGADLET